MRLFPNHHARDQIGFTLVELMVVIAIIAIIAAIAVPSFRDLIRDNRASSHTNELLGTFNLARSEAIRRNGRVQICSANSTHTACGGASDWNNGWLLWADNDGDGAITDATEIIRLHQSQPGLITLTASNTVTQFGFDGRGLRTGGTNGAAITFTARPAACTTGRPLQRAIEVTTTGRINLSKQACP